MKSNNKISGLVNIDERTLFLNIYSKIDKDNEDFNNGIWSNFDCLCSYWYNRANNIYDKCK